MTNSNDKKATGYRRPPQSGQFKKGRSGNPKGRPKKKAPEPVQLADLPSEKIFRDQLYSFVKARSADGVQYMQFAEALIKTMQAEALKGRRLFAKDLMIMMRQWEREEAESAQELSDALLGYKHRNQAILDAAAKEGLPPPEVYPHPDDIVLDHKTYRYTLIGPFDETETAYYDRWKAIERLLMVWSEMLRRRGGGVRDDQSLHLAAYARVIDQQLPPSYQMSEDDWFNLHMRHQSMRKAALLQAQNTEVAQITVIPPAQKLGVALPERNIKILNNIAHSLCDAFDGALARAA